MSQQHVVFATPTLSDSFCSEWVESCRRTTRLLDAAGIKHDWIKHGGNPFVSNARNALVADFLVKFPTATDLFWLDDDIGWKASKVVEFLARPEELVLGTPPLKTSDINWPIDLRVDEQRFRDDPASGGLIERDGLVQLALGPLGFVRMKRAAVARLAARSRIYREPTSDTASREVWAVFQDGPCDGQVYEDDGVIETRMSANQMYFWGEDQVFFLKWHHLGGESWLDPDCIFTHRGRQIWVASFATYLGFFREKARATLAGAAR